MYANNFNGDQVQLGYIQATLEDKLYAIPGLTCDADLSVNMDGEAFNYYVRSKAATETGLPGKKVEFQSTGVKRVNEEFNKAKYIRDVIPYVNFATASPDVVGDKVVQDTITIANELNEEFVSVMKEYCTSTTGVAQGFTASTTWSGATHSGYDTLLKLRAEFKKKNQDHNVNPTACLVSSSLYSDLLSQNVVIFKDGKRFGELLGFTVIEVPSLDSATTFERYASGTGEDAVFTSVTAPACHAILMNNKAMISAENLRSLMVTDATVAGYPNGTLIAGELSTKIVPSALVIHGEASANGAWSEDPERLMLAITA